MSNIDLVVNLAKKLESLLSKEYGADGKGLHEKVSSVEGHLSPEIVRKIRKVASIRNRVVHEDGYELSNVSEFELLANGIIRELGSNDVDENSPRNNLYSSVKIRNYVLNFAVLASIIYFNLSLVWLFEKKSQHTPNIVMWLMPVSLLVLLFALFFKKWLAHAAILGIAIIFVTAVCYGFGVTGPFNDHINKLITSMLLGNSFASLLYIFVGFAAGASDARINYYD